MFARGWEVNDVSVLNAWSWKGDICFIWKVSMDIQAIYFMIDDVTKAQEDDWVYLFI